jgi:tRNA A-37 threonylcarbamoyl transferase component Bud32
MVVMERLENVRPWVKDAMEAQKAEVCRALQVMKEAGLVHGDLRFPNVLLRGQDKVFIIDFDFGGKNEQVSLPYYINKEAYDPVEVKPLQVINHKLDEDMVKKILF